MNYHSLVGKETCRATAISLFLLMELYKSLSQVFE